MKGSAVFFLTAFAVALHLSGSPAFAQHGGGHGSAGMGRGSAGTRGGSAEGKSSGAHEGKAASADTANKTPGQLLTQNTKLASRLQSLLPAGTDLQKAANGFKNLGQFVAAVHVSKNLGISFDDLKAKMTGAHPVSLGKAIHELKPSSASKTEAKKAEKQAKKDLEESEGAHS